MKQTSISWTQGITGNDRIEFLKIAVCLRSIFKLFRRSVDIVIRKREEKTGLGETRIK